MIELLLLVVGLVAVAGDDKAKPPPTSKPIADFFDGAPPQDVEFAGVRAELVVLGGDDDPMPERAIVVMFYEVHQIDDAKRYASALADEAAAASMPIVLVTCAVDGASTKPRIDAFCEQLSDYYSRPLVTTGMRGYAAALSANLVSIAPVTPAVVASLVVEPEGMEEMETPLRPLIAIGEVEAKLTTLLDTLAEKGLPVSIVTDTEPRTWALLTLAAAELRK